ncbi:MAG: hypothetical protein H7Z40_18700 [Phycisphaerae bacterium]|nr:hypothetical protein [Gemmatimonadaceae bacterium]
MDSLLRSPDWLPLERALKAEIGADASAAARAFRFVGYVNGPADVGTLRVYQHEHTRVHVTLDGEGRAYRYFADMDRYGSTDSEVAIYWALTGVR